MERKLMIPRVIHFFWFGNQPLSLVGETCLKSWQKYASGFQIVRHDDSNFDYSSCAFAVDAAKAEKWAFVTDYARFKVIYEEGGVYFDIGTELVKDINGLMSDAPFAAIEAQTRTIASGLGFAAPPKDPLVKEILDSYESLVFHDDIAFLRANTTNEIVSKVFEKHGFVRKDKMQQIAGWVIFPSIFFNPVFSRGGYRITEETYALHYSSASWEDDKTKKKLQVQKRLSPYIGKRPAEIVGRVYSEVQHEGFLKGIRNSLTIARRVLCKNDEN